MRWFIYISILLVSCTEMSLEEPFQGVEKMVSGGEVEITQLSDGRIKLEAKGYDMHTFRKWTGDLDTNENPLYISKADEAIKLKPTFEQILNLHENNHTITCSDALIGDVAKFDGVEITVADKETVLNYISEAKPLNTLCTSKIDGEINHLFDDVMEKYGSWDYVGDITHWDISNVTSADFLFSKSDFNQNISDWNVSNITSMNMMFCFATEFNHNLNKWNVSKAKSLVGMFLGARNFKGDIHDWKLNSAQNLDQMFKLTTSYNHDLSTMCIESVNTEPKEFALGSALTKDRFPKWGNCKN